MRQTLVRLMMLLIILSIAIALAAQTDSARLTGSVLDVQGAVVANATISLTNLGTGRVLTSQTGPEGTYNFTTLPPGKYKIEVKSGNFKTVTQEFTLQVSQVAAANFTLQPGSATESVEVTQDLPLVESASSNLSAVIVGRQVAELPLNGRNFTQLATLSPGVTRGVLDGHTSGAAGDTETFRYGTSGGAALVVNGLRPQANNFLLDGVDNNESLVNTIVFFPPAEAIQEFRIDTSIAPAQFGRAGGGVVNTSLKSGTNTLHGSAFFFTRNDNLDARRYFDAKYTNGKENPKQEFRRHQFGGTLGGAIIQNKLFFFGDYQGWRQYEPASGWEYATVPTSLMRQGNFSELLNPALAGTPVTIFNPITGAAFANNIIPSNMQNAAAVKYLNAFPAPNCDPSKDASCHYLQQNFKIQRNRIQDFDDYDVKIDYNIGQNDTLFGRWSYGKDKSVTSSRLLDTLPAGWGAGSNINYPRGLALGETHTFGANLVNEFRFGFTRTKFGFEPPMQDKMVSQELGIANANTNQYLGGGALIGGWNSQLEYTGDWGPYLVPQNTFQYSDTLSWNKANHVVKAGATIIRRQVNYFRPQVGKGYFYMNGNGRNAGDVCVDTSNCPIPYITGHEVSDLLAGFVARYDVGPAAGMQGTRNWEMGYFAQDDWKVTRRLTLNLGLRWDVYTWPYEVNNKQANFDVTTGKMLLAGQNGASRSFVDTDYKKFAPRVGFAYDIFGKGTTVLRGGYGIFYFMDRGGIDNQLGQNPPFTGQSSYRYTEGYRITFTGMGCIPGATGSLCSNLPVVTNNDPRMATGSLPAKTFANFNPNNPTDVNVFAVLPSNVPSRVQQWNLQLQHELGANMGASIAYVGTKGDNLATYYDKNKRAEDNTRLYPRLNRVNVQDTIGTSSYHALQTRLDRRMSKGLQLTASYTWSHAIDDSTDAFDNNSSVSNFRWLEMERASSNFDARHRLVVSNIYELPFGKGRSFAQNMPGVLEAILGGWQTNTIFTWQSGLPFDITQNNGNARPFITGTANNPRTLAKWFDTSVFRNNTDGLLKSNLRRNAFTGPTYKGVDFSVFKDFSITERLKTQFRTEIYNLTNSPNFAQPVSNFNDNNFGVINNVRQGSERQIQFALRMYF